MCMHEQQQIQDVLGFHASTAWFRSPCQNLLHVINGNDAKKRVFSMLQPSQNYLMTAWGGVVRIQAWVRLERW